MAVVVLWQDVHSIVVSVDDDISYAVFVCAKSRYGTGRAASLRFSTPPLSPPAVTPPSTHSRFFTRFFYCSPACYYSNNLAMHVWIHLEFDAFLVQTIKAVFYIHYLNMPTSVENTYFLFFFHYLLLRFFINEKLKWPPISNSCLLLYCLTMCAF